jgi:anti-sigma B factor antagonist
MKTSIRQLPNAIVLDVVGDIDLQNSPAMRKVLLDNLKLTKCLVVNLQQVPYIDSSGIASLVEGLKAAQNLKHRLVLYGLSKAAREVMRLTRLITVFEVYETEEQALIGKVAG